MCHKMICNARVTYFLSLSLKKFQLQKRKKKNTTLCTTLKKLRKGGDFTREKDARYLQQFGDTQLQRKLL